MTLRPAEADTGVRFRRTDLTNGTRSTVVSAERSNVGSTHLCTELRNQDGVSVMTVEHLLAALAGAGIDNVDVHISGPEVPILDGSAVEFLAAIEDGGVRRLDAERWYIRVLRPVGLQLGSSSAEFLPDDHSIIETEIEFPHEAIGRQRFSFALADGGFHDVAAARTFGFLAQAKQLQLLGYGLGANLDNTVVLDECGVMNHGGLRFRDEFVRHKALDACGDLMLAGVRILGRFRTVRGGHQLNHKALNCLLNQASAWEYVAAGDLDTATIRPEHPVSVQAAVGFAG